MKIVIYGANEIGSLIASEFYTDNDITVIDDEKNKSDTFDKLDVGFISGNASSIDVLKQADIIMPMFSSLAMIMMNLTLLPVLQ